MKFHTLVALALILLGVSACVIEPLGFRHGDGEGYGHERGVWRG